MSKLKNILATMVVAAALMTSPSAVAQESADAASEQLADISFEETLMIPEVPKKQQNAIKTYMAREAKALQKIDRQQNLGYKLETMRHGEIVIVTIPSSRLFAPNDSALMKGADAELRPFLPYFRTPDKFKVILAVHTDDTGSEGYLTHLAEARVLSLYDYFDENATETSQLMGYPIGASEPLKPNNTRDNRETNRRVEVFIMPGTALIEQAKSGRL
ncbi:MAG: OmpA family protein [Muribaculaceae bacterium]